MSGLTSPSASRDWRKFGNICLFFLNSSKLALLHIFFCKFSITCWHTRHMYVRVRSCLENPGSINTAKTYYRLALAYSLIAVLMFWNISNSSFFCSISMIISSSFSVNWHVFPLYTRREERNGNKLLCGRLWFALLN